MAEWLRELAVGQWFEAGSEPFEIVGVDLPAEVVLVQHYDGTLEDFDFSTWMALAVRPCAQPEDYSGAFDMDREDYGLERDDGGPPSHDNPLDNLDLREL